VVEENGQAIGAGKYFATPQPPEKEPKRFLTPFLHRTFSSPFGVLLGNAKLLYGNAANKECQLATADDIRSCLANVPEAWGETCIGDCDRATASCCLCPRVRIRQW
jgi:hypothetical protein